MKKGWQVKRLGEVVEIRNGRAQREVESANGEFPIYGSAGTLMGMARDFICEAGTTIIGRKGNINSPIYVETRFWNVDTAFGLAAKAGLSSRFLYFFCLSYDFSVHNRGTTIPSLVKSELMQINMPLPPLPEQRRIVGILDEAFAGLATAQANAEKNLQNARALFESHLNAVFTQRGPGWVEKKLGALSRINYGYTESASSEKVGPHFLRITDIQGNGVDWDSVPYCTIDTSAFPKYKLTDGDIVFARTGASTGKSYLVNNPPDSVFASYLIRVQLTDEKLLPQFVNLFFQTQSYWGRIRAGVSGSAQGGFNATKLGELVIPFPNSSKAQVSIAAQLSALSAETRRLTALYERKLAALGELKKSLLRQAFEGEL